MICWCLWQPTERLARTLRKSRSLAYLPGSTNSVSCTATPDNRASSWSPKRDIIVGHRADDTVNVHLKMRLLDFDLNFHEYRNNIPPYAILSHKWGAEEATYKDVLKKRNLHKAGFKKIVDFRNFLKARNVATGVGLDGVNRFWVDTCCINKDSSSELSEAINSMYQWYAEAQICYAFLSDARSLSHGVDHVMYDLHNSSWFHRGWTLQELIAPDLVVFVNQAWERVGYKNGFAIQEVVSSITGIPTSILEDHNKTRSLSVEQRMSWMLTRSTERPEDMAYCLLGLFDVFMPPIYGEGRENAERRLRHEISLRSAEDSANGSRWTKIGHMDVASGYEL